MGGRLGVAMGVAALSVSLVVAGPAHSAPEPVRVIEAEGMQVLRGAVVKEVSATGGLAVALRPQGVAQARVRTEDVGAVVLRARTRGCRRAPLLVSVSGRKPFRVRARGRWAEHRLTLRLPEGAKRVRVRFAGRASKRCRALIDRVRLPAPAPSAPSPPPSESVAAAPAPAPKPVRPVPLGASAIVQKIHEDARYAETLGREFRSLTPENEMKMEWLQPQEGAWNFAAADQLVDFAARHGMEVRGHTLVFGKQTPPWVGRKLLYDDVAKALREHIHTVMRRYAGRVTTWDVVNEAFEEDGSWRDNIWLQRLGTRYVELAFQYAREADPNARLVYNEFDAERDNGRRRSTLALVKHLKDKGLIDGVGLQMHVDLERYPRQAELEELMRRYEAMGVTVEVTEMDVIAQGDGKPETLARRLAVQADVYRAAASACAAVRACTKFTVWGVTDRYSWRGVEQLPLLFDADFQAKPALEAVRAVIG